MQRNPVLDHIALTLADPCHVGRDKTADHRAELGGVTHQMRDPRAPNLVLAGEAGDIATGAPDPLPIDHGRPSPRSRHMRSHLLAALATAKDQDFDPFRLRHELPPSATLMVLSAASASVDGCRRHQCRRYRAICTSDRPRSASVASDAASIGCRSGRETSFAPRISVTRTSGLPIWVAPVDPELSWVKAPSFERHWHT